MISVQIKSGVTTRWRCTVLRSWLFVVAAVFGSLSEAQTQPPKEQQQEKDAQEVVDQLEKPLYNPFLERYVLDELKQLRVDVANAKLELTREVVDRELSVSDKALNYATSTVTYFFYLIAGASSILVFIGWTSIRDLKDKVQHHADEEISRLVNIYEGRLQKIENEITQKSKHIEENRQEIELTQGIHALWLRAAQEHAPQNKISLYDEILRLHPNDVEALTYKADAVLDINEPQWAMNLCQQALFNDPNYAHAYYQLACSQVALGQLNLAVSALREAVARSDFYVEEMARDEALRALRDHEGFQQIIEQHAADPETKA